MISVIVPIYRNAASALALLESLLRQRIPDDTSLEIVVVDDGSADGSTDLLREREGPGIRVVALPRNMGRAIARNAGAAHAGGEFLFFIDSDCRPEDQGFLAAHLHVLQGGAIASLGPVAIPGGGNAFWSRYQNEASDRRARQHASGMPYSGSTANFAVRADAYRQSGGFDARYLAYGFEDRDLLVRLSRLGRLDWCPEARVTHADALTLNGVLEKMRTAAGASAILFSHDHAEAYRALGFAALDARLHPWLRPIAALASPMLRAAPLLDCLLGQRWIPHFLARPMVKVLVALAYMQGTTLTPKRGQAPRPT